MDKTEKFKKIEQELLDTYIKKNSDYGESVTDTLRDMASYCIMTKDSRETSIRYIFEWMERKEIEL